MAARERTKQNHPHGRTEAAQHRHPQRNAALDGYRALAIAAVVCYHLDFAWLPSGHLGVVMFLVLSGYLVTSSLLRRMSEGAMALPRFWVGRLRRIWPPMALMVAATVLACIAFNHVLLTKARPDVLPALGLFENASYVVRNLSYFDQIGGPSPLTHLWYLGVDAQFCLVWPVVMLLAAAVFPSRSQTRWLCLVLALVSAGAMAALYDPDAGITRVYYGTDTRAFAPLAGAWLAYVAPLGRRPARALRASIERYRLGIEVAALVLFVALVAGMVLVPDTSTMLYRGGMFAAALSSATLLAAMVLPGGIIKRVLELPPLAWLGSRSFGIYLWHYPLIQLLGAAAGDAAPWRIAVVVVASLAAGELSWRLVEQPLAKGTLGDALLSLASRGRSGLRSPAGIAAIALVLVVVTDALGLALVPEETLVPEEAIVSTGEAADRAMDLSEGRDQPAGKDLPDVNVVLRAAKDETEAGVYDPVIIADSVPGDAEPYWLASCPDGLMDSYVGRRPDQALSVLREYLDQGVVGKIVILQAFSNVISSAEELDEMVAACGQDRIVYLVNVRIPESNETAINELLAACAERHDNVHLIDWHALSEGHDAWLYADGEHLTPEGQPYYIGMLVDAIRGDFEALGGTASERAEGEVIEGSGKSVVVDNAGTTAQDEGDGEQEQDEGELDQGATDEADQQTSGEQDEATGE